MRLYIGGGKGYVDIPTGSSAGDLTNADRYSFVFQPNGVTSAPVYATEAELIAAMNLVPGPKLLTIDTTFGPAVFTMAHNLEGVTLRGKQGDQLTFADGSSIVNTNIWAITQGLGVFSSSASPIWEPVTGLNSFFPSLFISQNSALASSVSPFIHVAAGQGMGLDFDTAASMFNAGSPVIQVDVTGQADLVGVAFGGPGPNTVVGAGTLNYTYDSSAFLPPQTVTTQNLRPVSIDSTFVFQPLGVDNANVFTVWADLYNAYKQVAGPKTIQIKGNATIPAGSYNLDDATFVDTNFETLTIADGAHFTNPNYFRVKGGLTIKQDGSTPAWEMPADANLVLDGYGCALSSNTGKAAFAHVAAGTAFGFFNGNYASIGNGADTVVSVDGGAQFTADCQGIFDIFANCFTGAGTLLAIRDDTLTMGAQPGIGVLTFGVLQAQAGLEIYFPAIPPDWPGSPSSLTVKAALDDIAAGSAGGGWRTVLDIDLTAEGTQTLSPDGPYTIGGLTWTKALSTFDQVAMQLTNGVGLIIQPKNTSAWDAAGARQTPMIQLPLLNIPGLVNADWTSKLRIWMYISSITAAGGASSDQAIAALNFLNSFDGGALWNDYVLFVGNDATNANGSQVSTFYQNNIAASPTAAFVLANRHVQVMEASCNDDPIRSYYADGAGNAFVTPQNLILGNDSRYTSGANRRTTNGTVQGPFSNMAVSLAAQGTSGTMSVTISRVRVDFHP